VSGMLVLNHLFSQLKTGFIHNQELQTRQTRVDLGNADGGIANTKPNH
jgi:hypothetical protein